MYDYREAMTEDVKQWITDEVNLADWTEDRGGLEQQLNDDLWTADSVTGNGSGSYTFNRVQASLYVLDNMDLLQKAINEFATDPATVGDKFISEDYNLPLPVWQRVSSRPLPEAGGLIVSTQTG